MVIVIFLVWAYSVSTLETRDCDNLNYIYNETDTHIQSICNRALGDKYVAVNDLFDGAHSIVNAYYIKTAYNCCSPGNFKNSFVSICALKKVINFHSPLLKNYPRFYDWLEKKQRCTIKLVQYSTFS